MTRLREEDEGGAAAAVAAAAVPSALIQPTRLKPETTTAAAAAAPPMLLHDGEVEDGTCAICLDAILEADVAMVKECLHGGSCAFILSHTTPLRSIELS